MSAHQELIERFQRLKHHAAASSEAPVIANFTSLLTQVGFYANQIASVVELEGCPPRHRAPRHPIPEALQHAIGIRSHELYLHQAQVYDLALEGKDVVIATPTASGKSLAFLLPVMARLLADEGATALLLYPTKALAHDQAARLEEFDARLGGVLRPAVYDGDTPTAHRAAIKQHSRILVTNPHGLHLYLGWHQQWARLLGGLVAIVLDEAHVYTGILGAQMAGLWRRLERILSHHRAHPLLLAASASIANPREHLAALTGRAVTLVDNGAGRGPRTLVLWDATRHPTLTPTMQSAYLARHLMRHHHQVVVFSNTRAQAEQIALAGSERGHRMLPYRAGYAPATRRRIEEELREGRLQGVSATSALELGVDVGGLDCAILNGYPGSISSLWQRLGRAGRSMQPSLGVVVLGHDPVARSLVASSDLLLRRAPEAGVIPAEHDEVRARHLVLALAELPCPRDALVRDPRQAALVERLLAEGRLIEEEGVVRSAVRFPHLRTPFVERPPSWRLVLARGSSSDVEHLDDAQALREAHRGAILLHLGTPYRVTRIDEERREVHARPESSHHLTIPSVVRTLSRGRLMGSSTRGPLLVEYREGTLTERVASYQELDPATGQTVRHGVRGRSLRSPVATLALVVADPSALGLAEELVPLGLRGLAHAIDRTLPVLAIGDRGDLGSLTVAGAGTPSLVLFHRTRFHPSSLLARVERELPAIIELAASMIAECGCEDGCAFCVLDHGPEDGRPSRAVTLATARGLIAAMPDGPPGG